MLCFNLSFTLFGFSGKSKSDTTEKATKKDECRILIFIDLASLQVISDQEEVEQVNTFIFSFLKANLSGM